MTEADIFDHFFFTQNTKSLPLSDYSLWNWLAHWNIDGQMTEV